MFACTRLDCPLELVARRDKKKEQLRRQKNDLHAAQVRERKAAQEQLRKDECQDEVARRACVQRPPPHTSTAAQRALARLEVLQRKRQLDAERAEQLKWEMENKQQRFKPRTRSGTPQGNQKQEKVQQNRQDIIQKRQEQVETEFEYKEYKAELRLKEIKDNKNLQHKKLYETSKVTQNKVRQKRDEIIKKEQCNIKNEMMIKDLKTAQNLGIEIKPVIKKKYVPRPKPIIVREKVTEFDVMKLNFNLKLLRLTWGLIPRKEKSRYHKAKSHKSKNPDLSKLDKDLEFWGFEPRKVLPLKIPPCRPWLPGELLETTRSRGAPPLQRDLEKVESLGGEPLEKDVDPGKVNGSPCEPIEKELDVEKGGELLEKNVEPSLDGEPLEKEPHKPVQHWVSIKPVSAKVPATFENYVSSIVHALPGTEEKELLPECDNAAVWGSWRRELQSRVLPVPGWQVRERQRAVVERTRRQQRENEREFAAACLARGDH